MMQKYFNTVTGRGGAAISRASVLVKTLAGATATVYSDNSGTVAANPLTTDSNGYFEFYAADGRYTLEISGRGITSRTISDILLEDPADGSAALAAAGGAALVGFQQSGTGAVARTVQDKLQEVVTFEDKGAIGDGIADDTAAIVAAYTASSRVKGLPGKTYKISSLAFPEGTHIEVSQSVFRADGTVTGNGTVILLGAGCRFDTLNVTTPAVTSQRVIIVDDDTEGDYINLVADGTVAANDTLDGAIQISARARVYSVYVKNFDYSLKMYSTTGGVVESAHLGFVEVENYVRAVYVRNARNGTIGFVKASGKSVNASQLPGHNGILTAGIQDFTIGGYQIADAGEHGIRIGGTNGAELQTENVRLGAGQVLRPGQCGIKVNPDSGQRVKYLTIGDVTTLDCAYGNTVGANEDAVRIENADHVTVGKVSAFKKDKSNSCNDGVFIADCTNVTVDGYHIDSPARSGLYLAEESDGVVGSLSDIYVGPGAIINSGLDSVVVAAPASTLTNVVVDRFISRAPVRYSVNVSALATAGAVLLRGESYSPGTGHYAGSTLPGIMLDIGADGRYRSIGPALTQAPIGTKYIRDAGFNPSTISGEIRGTIVLSGTDAPATGTYTPAIVGTKNQSNRRRWAIAGYASGADDDQYGIRMFGYSNTTTGSDLLTYMLGFTHAGVPEMPLVPTYADNAAATAGGLTAGQVYKTATGELRIRV